MTSWQGAMALLRFEGRQSWIGLLITIAFYTYVNVIMLPVLQELLTSEGGGGFGWIGDFLYLTILPMMGFVMNRSMFRYWIQDPYTRKLAYWRTMPIGWDAIVLSRMLQHVIVMTFVAAYYFVLQYVLLGAIRELLSPGEYVLYALTWYGYALMAGATYVFFEQTVRGKTYLAVCFGYVLVFVLLELLLRATDTELLFRSIEEARGHRFAWPAVSLVLGAGATALIGFSIRKRLAKRSLLL
ncbi:hypothetical protein [Paenibacillus sacheonensis]|uniref:ABC transporter permease n=1 Tax=Paenibacillus sacheonensis TaxID=742054 RepID=A0A7X4YNG4_9BACL|nr:hypothetical protein [Paenibacillus sacheonensis]MBM7566082.1 hypothetical protein [Paenibacillus sacheonensis]NBC68609.1 hypothetical protein [Paenibacillus sacheonensis]